MPRDADSDCITFSPDGRLIAAEGGIWDLASGTLVRVLAGVVSSFCSLACSPDGRMLAAGYSRLGLQLWDPAIDNPLRSLAGYDSVTSVAFSRDGRTLAGADERTVRLWDPARGTEGKRLEGYTDTVRAVAFSPDGERLASAARDRTVRLWDPASGRLTGLLRYADDFWVS